MVTNLRVSLTILSVGFGIEGVGESYSLLSRGAFLPGTGLLLVVPSMMTLVGLLFVWIGRHEWNELHRSRVRAAHIVFGLSLLAGIVASGIVALLVACPTWGAPGWARGAFAVAVGTLAFGTFVTYVLLVFHLVGVVGKGALVASLIWGFGVSSLVAIALSNDLPTILLLIAKRSLSASSLLAPINSLASFFFVSYFLLLAAYVDAHYVVAGDLKGSGRGPDLAGSEQSTP